MSIRVNSGALGNLLNPFGPSWPTGQSGQAQPVGRQVQQALFGNVRPGVLDPRFLPPEVQALLAALSRVRKKIALMVGDSEEDYRVVPSDCETAMVDAQGIVYFGTELIQKNLDSPDLLFGILGHEIGHRPKRWGQIKLARDLSQSELFAICRDAEDEADRAAGQALAELGLSPKPMIKFLESLEVKQRSPHPEYYPVDIRAETIHESYNARICRAKFRRGTFPDLDRATSPFFHLGDG